MDWCVDGQIATATSDLEAEVCAHLARHALNPMMVELARPVLRELLEELPPGPAWVSLDWEDTQPKLSAIPLAQGSLPGVAVAPGVTRAHRDLLEWLPRLTPGPSLITRRLPVIRPPEGDLDPMARSDGGVLDGLPASLAGVLADEIARGRSLEEAAARAGATLAERETREGTPQPTVEGIALAFIEAERKLGGDFRLVVAEGQRAVLQNARCPFGPSARPALCRFSSALAGGLAARTFGRAEVTLDERIALGDYQCRLILDLDEPSGRLTSHRYSFPPVGLSSAETDEHPALTHGFRVTLSLQLPRDRLSVPVTRHLIAAAMREVGVIADDLDDVELALSEACANVIDHSGPGDAYEVAVTVGPAACHIRVIDIGHGFDHHALAPQMADLDAEHGRGVALMHALVDQVRFESEPERGTIVHLVKQLHFDDSVPARRLMLESLDTTPPDPEPGRREAHS
jgi:serine/threonine-protein kinase RsbW